MVSCFPLDYMRLVCLGVVKKMIGYWMSGSLKCRLSGNMLQRVNNRIKNISASLPGGFNRKLRPISEFVRWKATELRSFCLYYGQYVLKDILPTDYYQHFLQLSVAINILDSPKLLHKVNAADILLKKIVRNFAILYGNQSIIYNVHNLIHLADDCKRFGPLDAFSAFVFENYLKKT